MSDLSSGQNPEQSTLVNEAKRPGVATLLAVLVFVAVVVQLVSAVTMVVLALRPQEVQQLFGSPVSDWYWIFNAILTFALALIYIWMGKGILRGNPQAWILLNVIALINIFFSVFQISTGIGWATMVINIIILGLNNTTRVRIWFSAI